MTPTAESAPVTTTRRIIAFRVALLVTVIPILVFYLAPRVIDLINLPFRLDHSVASAQRYNPALHAIVEHEEQTVNALDVVNRMQQSLTEVQVTDSSVSTELNTLIAQIRTNVTDTLSTSNQSLNELIHELNTLAGRIDSLRTPARMVDGAVTQNKQALGSVLSSVRSTADKVARTSKSARSSADHLSGDSHG